MIWIGHNITSNNDPLQPCELERLHKSLCTPGDKVMETWNQLQLLATVDTAAYRKHKTRLPYIVTARFHPLVRRKENFLSVQYFIIDIDHLSANELLMEDLRNKLVTDERLLLLFTSPSGDGLKLLFELEKPITDAGYYALFYRAFCRQIDVKFRLGAAIDKVTHDVTRACFVSFDPNAYFNPNAIKVDADNILSTLPSVNEEEAPWDKEQTNVVPPKSATRDDRPINEAALAAIKQKIGFRTGIKKQKEYEQPEELQAVLEKVEAELNEVDVLLEKALPISYGKQIKIRAAETWAELNIFYGKKGVSVIPTTRTGSNKELANMVKELLLSRLNN